MRRSGQSDKAHYEAELRHYRSMAKTNKRALEGKPFLAVHLNFWLESTRFLITELEIWEYQRNKAKYYQTIDKINKALNHLHRLVIYLDDDPPQEDDPDTEI